MEEKKVMQVTRKTVASATKVAVPAETGKSCCSGSAAPTPDGPRPNWVSGFVQVGCCQQVPVVHTTLNRCDKWGAIKVRWDLGRMSYKVSPGLYAVGKPDAESPVLVSANYKLSFDMLRKELGGLNAWILVIDTKGINVWCAAGKGTFSAEEIAKRIYQTGLAKVVTHRTLILPQLAAPGVVAHKLTQVSGFKVVYGPVRAADIRAFLAAGMVATPEMRRVQFTVADRAKLAPVELVAVLKPLLITFALLFVYNLITPKAIYSLDILLKSLANFVPFLGAVVVGAVLTPILLPWIPGRAFAWKGWLLGLVWAIVVSMGLGFFGMPANWEMTLANILILPAISAFLAMNFTGSSTYTSFSGVKKEMRIAFPMEAVFFGAGVLCFIINKIVELVA